VNDRSKKDKKPTMAGRALDAAERFLQRISERQGPARQFVHMAHLLVVGVRRSQLTRMAAALSYRTIFGLIPVLVIGMLLIAAFASEAQVEHVAVRGLKFTGLSAVLGSTPADAGAPTQGAATPGPFEASPSTGTDTPPSGTQPSVSAGGEKQLNPQLKDWIDKLYKGIKSLPTGPAGVIGILTLVYAAVSMLVEVEKAFNQIYNAPEGRSWVRRVTQYWTLLTLGALFLILSFFVQERIFDIAREFTASASGSGYRRLLLHGLGFVLTVGISSLLLLIMFMIVPNTRVMFLPALIGAVTAAILWESGKWGFGRYVSYINTHDTGYSRFYGAVAILPLFMLWIYVTWLIVLSGLQLASALQAHRLTDAEGFHFSVLATFGLIDEERAKHNVKIIDPASVLVVMTAVAERFASGKPSDHSHIAASTGIDEQAVADMLERLAGAGLLLRVANAEREGTYALARPPEAIQAVQVLSLAQELVGNSRVAENKVLVSLTRARVQALEGKTVADLMDRPQQPGPAAPQSGPAAPDPASLPDKSQARAVRA
jgi:membrane protein